MSETRLRWLLDVGIPRTSTEALDAVHAEDLWRIPGPVGLRECIALERTLVTLDQEFLGPWDLLLTHPGIVIFESSPVDGQEVERNLRHLEFRLSQGGQCSSPAGARFILKMDRAIFQVHPDGSEQEFEPWKRVRLETAVRADVHRVPLAQGGAP